MNDLSSEDNRILILGCGFSGMLTALALAHKGIRTTIIEAKSTKSVSFFNDARTTAITSSSQAFLDKINVWSTLASYAGDIIDIYVVDNKDSQMLHFDSTSANDKAMGYLIKNYDFKNVLINLINNNDLITLIDNCTYSDFDSKHDGFILYLDNEKYIDCRLLILCEGYKSRIKQVYFDTRQDFNKFYHQIALTFNVFHTINHECTAIEHFMSSGPFAILPLKDRYCSSVVWTLEDKYAAVVRNLKPEEFQYMIQQNFGDFLGIVKLDGAVTNHTLKAYLSNRYFHQKIVLVGDSAHIIHPLAGQGLNMGIKDIDLISNLITKNGLDKDSLKHYESVRKPDNKHMFIITDNLNKIFTNNSSILKCIRKIGFTAIERYTPLKNFLMKYAMGRRSL